MRGANPMADRNRSASSTCWAPPFAGLTVTRTPEPVSSMASTFVEVSTLTPSFLYALASSADTSASSVGTMRSRYSTMVTSAPNWLST